VKLPLDTQVAIWAVASRDRLGRAALELIEDGENEVAVSAVGVLEVAIKYPLLSRRDRPPFSGALALAAFRGAGFRVISVTADHAATVEALPPMHADPFDRLLLAQALHESMRLLTADRALQGAHESVIPA